MKPLRPLRTFHIHRPFNDESAYTIRVVILPRPRTLLMRYNMTHGRKCGDPLRGYWVARSFMPASFAGRSYPHLRGEIGFALSGLDIGVMVHEGLHCVRDAIRDKALQKVEDCWEETQAYALQSLVGILDRRTRSLRKT